MQPVFQLPQVILVIFFGPYPSANVTLSCAGRWIPTLVYNYCYIEYWSSMEKYILEHDMGGSLTNFKRHLQRYNFKEPF